SFERAGLLQKSVEWKTGLRLIERVRLRPPQPGARTAVLSGGNQQKVMLMKGLVRAVRIYLFDEPTQGIDIGAKAEIYQFLHRLAADGAAVLFITSDLLELLNMCHRMIIFYRGQVSAALAHGEATEERLLRHYFGEVQEASRERAG
ncbi:MAG TPA: ATP-binding cassette domain-containing protein, partial [bacterium]